MKICRRLKLMVPYLVAANTYTELFPNRQIFRCRLANVSFTRLMTVCRYLQNTRTFTSNKQLFQYWHFRKLSGYLLTPVSRNVVSEGGSEATVCRPAVSFSSCQQNLIKTFQIEGMITHYKNGLDFLFRLVKWPKIAVKNSQKFQKF